MTEAPPDWAVRVPSTPGVHHQPPETSVWQEMSQEQAHLLRQQFKEAIIGLIVEAVRGIFVHGPLGSAFDQLVEWAQGILGEDFIQRLFGIPGKIADDVADFIRSLFGLFPAFLDRGDGTLIPNILATITDRLDGTVEHIQDGIHDLVENFDGTRMSLQHMLQNFQGTLGTYQGLLDGLKNALAGIEDAAETGVHHVVSALQHAIENIAAGLFGLFLGGGELGGLRFGWEHIRIATSNTASSLVALSQAIAALTQSGATLLAEVNFTTLTDSASLPAGFATTYSGSPYGTYGVLDGLADWRNLPAFPYGVLARSQYSRWTLNDTSGDDQIICTVFGSTATGTCFNTINGRMNAAGDDRVEAQFKGGKIYLRSYIGGTPTGLLTVDHDQKIGSPYYFRLGVDGVPRKFVLYDGNLPILTYTDAGAVSAMDASHRSAGMGADYYLTRVLFPPSFTSYAGGRVAYWSISEPEGGS